MSKKCVYVGNLPRECTEEKLRSLFEGQDVESVKLVVDHKTGRSRGFAFVEMESEEAAASALESLRGKELDGRELKVGTAYREKMGSGSGPSDDYGGGRPGGMRRRGRR